MRLKIKRLDPSIGLPVPATGGAAGFDLAASADLEIPPRAVRLVGTGLVIAVPDGYFLGIFARSSTPLKKGLMVANGVGVVDADYCGPADDRDPGAERDRRARAGEARRPPGPGHRAPGATRGMAGSRGNGGAHRGGFGSTGT